MDILKKLFIFSFPLLLTGCYADYVPNIDTTPVLCLNSLITAGSPIEVNVTHTWVLTDSNGHKDHSVNDATLSIYVNDNLVDSDYIPAEGDRIRIEAHSDKYGDAQAEVTVPFATQISSLDYIPKLSDFDMSDTEGWGINADIMFDVNISMTLADTDNADNFHRLDYRQFDINGIYTDNEDFDAYDEDLDEYDFDYGQEEEPDHSYRAYFSSGSFETIDPVFYEQSTPFDDVMNSSYYNLFFSDRFLNRETNTVEFGFSPCFFKLSGWDGDKLELDCGWEITLYSISDSYYKWLTYYIQSDGIIMGDMSELGLADPTWGYSNVSTGAGVVAAQSSVTIKLNLQDFLESLLSPPAP